MLTFVLPHFLSSPPDFMPPKMPAFNQWLRFGYFYANFRQTSQLYAQYLGFPDVSENTVFATPIWQNVGMNSAQMCDSRHFSIHADEAQALIDALNQFYGDEARWTMLNEGVWLMTLPQIPDWKGIFPIFDVVGQADAWSLIGANAAPQWLKFSTEIQMFLHDHAVNRARKNRGVVPINGVWLWSPEVQNGGFQAALIGADSVWARAKKSDNIVDFPENFSHWQQICAMKNVDMAHTVLWLEDFVCGDDDVLARLERDFFAPAEQALRAGLLRGVRVVCEAGDLHVGAARWAFWRRKKSFDGKHLG